MLAMSFLAPIVDTASPAYRTGAVAGRIVFALIVIAVIVKVVRWLRK
jgi:hypothetical protein